MGRASIVGAAETSVGKVREHNEDAHFIDTELAIFGVCDGMGGHAAGEVASGIAVDVVREQWSSDATLKVVDAWLEQGTLDARKALLAQVNHGVIAAHDAIMAEATRDRSKNGMGTTIIAAMVIGGDIVFAQCGDSRAYLVRDGIAMQLTEDHTLLARLLAAGVDVDTSNEGSRFKSMLTNALGIGPECKAATFVVPLADGDRFLLCSDGITEYINEPEIGDVLTAQPSPARAAQKLVELALARGGGDNATALVVRVLEAGETARPAELLHRENKAINACPLWAKITPQGRLRALRISLPRDHVQDERIPAQTLGDRVAWILVDGEVEQDGVLRGPGSLLYPEALLKDAPLPDKDGLAVAASDVRALALRCDDFHELCEDDAELGELLLAALAAEIATRKARPARIVVGEATPGIETATTDPNMRAVAPGPPPSSASHPASHPPSSSSSHPPSQPPPNVAAALPAVPKPTAPRLGRSPTPPSGRPSQLATGATIPPPIVAVPPITGREATIPPPVIEPVGEPAPAARDRASTVVDERAPQDRASTVPDDDPARGPTAPMPIARPKDAPAVPRIVIPAKGAGHGERLIVPQSEAGAAAAQLDRAFDGLSDPPRAAHAPITLDPGDGGLRPPAKLPLPPPDDDELTIEAEEPPTLEKGPHQIATKKSRAIGDQSEPEISIERFVELEVEEPMNESRDEGSAPEIMIVRPGRAITAGDTDMVAGSIETAVHAELAERAETETEAADPAKKSN